MAKVSNFQDPGFGEHEVLGLDVAVDDPHGVHVGQAGEELFEVAVCLGGGEAAGLEEHGEVASFTDFKDFIKIPFFVCWTC